MDAKSLERLSFLPNLTPGALLHFLLRRDDQVPIAEFEGHDDVRVAFHGAIAALAGYDVDTISGAPAIILKRVDGKPSPLLGHWTGIGDYTRNVQHCMDQLEPPFIDSFELTKVGDRCRCLIGYKHIGDFEAVSVTPGRAYLMAWLKYMIARAR